MTEDFKKKILDWISANYTTSSGNNVPQFSDVDSETNDLETQLNTLFPYDYVITGSLQANDVNGDGLKYTIAYGEYNPTSSSTLDEREGFIVILDENFTLLQCITQYASGTHFGYFEIIGVGDDGNFFAIERVNTTKRFVMMNNIIAKLPEEANYKVVLRRSYNLQGASVNIDDDDFKILIKAPEQSIYMICGINNSGKVIATELVINVGTSNEWNDYSYSANYEYTIGDIYANWDSQGNLNFKLAGFYVDDVGGNTYVKYAELSGSSNNVGVLTLTKYNYQFAEEYLINSDVKIINSNEAYFSVGYTTEDDYGFYKYLEIVHFNNGNTQSIYYKKTSFDPDCKIVLYRIDTEVFYLEQYTDDDDNYVLQIGKIIGNNVYTKVIGTSEDTIDYMFFAMQKQFNLYNYYVQTGNSVDKVNQVYNANDYNGQEYQALNSMIPKSAELISESVIVFARDLYNKYINNNTTISTINVPNSYTNDVVIDAQNLYGETKSELVQNNQDIETNIYEELMINFVNTLLMTNENDINNIIENLDGAIRVNKSISSLMDYDSCKITKFKINYSDNTNIVGTITNNNITYLSNKVVYKFLIYNNENKRVESIQLLSNDETTIYQTIDCTNLETNKYYMLEQDLHIN